MNKQRILVADDEAGMRMTLSDILSENGHEVSIAEDGREAFDMCLQGDFDVALIGAELPPINGLDCYLAPREISPTITAIIVCWPAKEMHEIAAEAIRNTAYTRIVKPIQPDALSPRVEKLQAQRMSDAIEKPKIDKRSDH